MRHEVRTSTLALGLVSAVAIGCSSGSNAGNPLHWQAEGGDGGNVADDAVAGATGGKRAVGGSPTIGGANALADRGVGGNSGESELADAAAGGVAISGSGVGGAIFTTVPKAGASGAESPTPLPSIAGVAGARATSVPYGAAGAAGSYSTAGTSGLVSPGSGAQLQIVRSFAAPENCTQLAHDGSNLYCGPANAAALQKIDPATGAVVGTFNLSGAAANQTDKIVFVTGGGGHLFVVPTTSVARPSPYGGTSSYPQIEEFDAATGKEIGRIRTSKEVNFAALMRAGAVFAGDHLVLGGLYDTIAPTTWFYYGVEPTVGRGNVADPWGACGYTVGSRPAILKRVMYGAVNGELRCIADGMGSFPNGDGSPDISGWLVAESIAEPVISVAADSESLWIATAAVIYQLSVPADSACVQAVKAGSKFCNMQGEGDVYADMSIGAGGTGSSSTGSGSATGTGSTGSGASTGGTIGAGGARTGGGGAGNTAGIPSAAGARNSGGTTAKGGNSSTGGARTGGSSSYGS